MIKGMTSKGVKPPMIKSIEVVSMDADGSMTVKLSGEALMALQQMIEAGRPTVKARREKNQLRRLEQDLEQLSAVEREVKAKQMAELLDPAVARFLAMKRGPLDWPG